MTDEGKHIEYHQFLRDETLKLIVLDEVFEFTSIGDDSNSFHCSSCNISFANCEEHLKEHHSKTVVDLCEIEDEALEYIEAEGLAFVIKNADGKFECQENGCSRTYKNLRRFLDHVKTHGTVTPASIQKLEEFLKQLEDNEDIFELKPFDDGSGRNNYKCRVCNTVFDCRKKMLLHYPIHRNVARAHKQHHFGSGDLLHCKLCNRSLNNEYEFKLHVKAHEENQAQESKQGTTSRKIINKKIVVGDNKSTYPCQYCQKLFKRPHEKVKHER